MTAAADTSPELLPILVQHSDVNTQDNLGHTPLHSIVEITGRPDLVETLIRLAKNIDINKKNLQGNTPLHHILTEINKDYIDLDYIRLLLEHGADIYTKNKNNKTPLEIAQRLNDKKILDLFKQYSHKTSPLTESLELLTRALNMLTKQLRM